MLIKLSSLPIDLVHENNFVKKIDRFHITAVDLHSFYVDPDPSVFLNADPDPEGKMNADRDPA